MNTFINYFRTKLLQLINTRYVLIMVLCVDKVFHRRHLLNSLWFSDAMCRQISELTLARVMARCLAVPSYYLKQCDNHLRSISQEIPQPFITNINLKITYLKFHANLLGANELILVFKVWFIANLTFRTFVLDFCPGQNTITVHIK